MKKINFKIKNVRLAFTLLIILAFIVLLLYYHFVLSPSFAKSNFTNQMIEIADENENSIFNVQKILLYSSANAISNSKDQSLKDMSICQYTDLSIYIDNSQSSSELTDENSVKELYIDNIVMTSNVDKGTKILNYKNEIKKELEVDEVNDDSLGADFYEIDKLSKDELSSIAILELEKLGYKLK